MQNTYYIIDFDSTFVTVEALDELAAIALKKNPNKEQIVQEIKSITTSGMNGDISFPESLSKRLSLFAIDKNHIKKLVLLLKKHVTPSVERNLQFFKEHREAIYVISGGFKEYIVPIVKPFGIKEHHVLANTFTFNEDGQVTGYDKKNPLSQEHGKVEQMKALQLKGEILVLGDGMTDYQIKQQGYAKNFYAFTENIRRAAVIEKADKTIGSFDEFLFIKDMPRAVSYPKSKMKVLLLENIDHQAEEIFKKQGYEVERLSKALGEEDLIKKIKDVSVLGIRSKTELTASVLDHANKLLAVGAYCIGTNQINLKTAAEKGIAVFNAPYSNTRSVVELAIGEIIMLYRKTFDKSSLLHQGKWDKSAVGSHEIRGKKLGIIGYGNIGAQLSVLAENLGMRVYFYNTSEKLALGNAQKCSSLEELLKIVDIVSVHVSGKKSNTNLIGEKEFAMMKDGVIFLNLSRGFVINVQALAEAIKTGKVAGTAVDVFPREPKSNDEPFITELQGLPNVILTPHIAGSTTESQKAIGEFVTQKLTQFIDTGNTTLSVNLPNIQLPELVDAHRFIHTHKNQPGILAQINNIFARNKINIEGQYLKTNEEVGYVITDVNKNYSKKVIDELKLVPGTIKIRVLY